MNFAAKKNIWLSAYNPCTVNHLLLEINWCNLTEAHRSNVSWLNNFFFTTLSTSNSHTDLQTKSYSVFKIHIFHVVIVPLFWSLSSFSFFTLLSSAIRAFVGGLRVAPQRDPTGQGPILWIEAKNGHSSCIMCAYWLLPCNIPTFLTGRYYL